jgi:cation diffusion facilitator CzcD-associated flavoprotein CzcO
VGTGFAGLGMAIALTRANERSFVLLERADDVGGTWRENTYPGCACDIPSHLYSFSFEPNPRWSRLYAPQREILDYLRHCADRYRLRPHIRFGAEVVDASYDEAQASWRVVTQKGDVLRARHLVLGLGPLNRPAIPRLEGLERFRGAAFHSARWDHAVPLRGKDVAVIGTGASAIQFVPQVATIARRLHLFQRTAPWVLPRRDRPISTWEQRAFAAAPILQRLGRAAIYWRHELGAVGLTRHPALMKLVAREGRRHIRRQLKDERLRALVTPTYLPGCKRILLANDYYPTLERGNVELVTERITRVTEDAVVTADGTARRVDAILFGTGFLVGELLTPLRIRGRGGALLNDVWRERPSAYLGTTVAGFPNCYALVGPNTGLGHNSMVFMIEAQVRYVMQCLREQARCGARSADVLPSAQERFNAGLAPRLARTVWASGCQSWYLGDDGTNATLWPGFTFEFWLRTLRMKPSDYEFEVASDGHEP